METNQKQVPPSLITIKNQLQQQEKELAVLNAIIQTVSNSYNLRETLEKALEIVLALVNSDTGWICLVSEDNACSSFVGYKGLCFAEDSQASAPCLVRCVCDKVRKTREVVIVKQLNQGCPLLVLNDEQDQAIIGHISVPLTTKSRLVGQLNVAFTDPQQADKMDINLLKSIGPQLAVAVENARLWEEVLGKEELQKELLKKVVAAQEEERRRISRELHDEFGQELTSLLFRLQFLEKINNSPKSEEVLEGIKGSVTQLLNEIHDLSLELRPTSLDDLGLVAALAQYTKSSQEHLGIQVDFAAVGVNGHRFSREVETTLYRIAQEALTNVARHAGVKQASVLLKMDEQEMVVIIEDRGNGFDPNLIHSRNGKKNRLGLYGMEERVSLIGGKFTLESQPGKGTTVYVVVPVSRPVER